MNETKREAPSPAIQFKATCGAIAQLGERLHGMQEVSGSIPLSSTNFQIRSCCITANTIRMKSDRLVEGLRPLRLVA